MKSSARSFPSGATAVTTINLSQLGWESPNDIFEIGTFNIEVVGNDAEVSVKCIGPFANSAARTPEGESTFPIGGGTLVVENVAIGKLEFTRVGTTAYTINVTKSVE